MKIYNSKEWRIVRDAKRQRDPLCELCKHNVIDWPDRCKEADYSCEYCKDIGCKCRTCNAHHNMWEWREDRGAK